MDRRLMNISEIDKKIMDLIKSDNLTDDDSDLLVIYFLAITEIFEKNNIESELRDQIGKYLESMSSNTKDKFYAKLRFAKLESNKQGYRNAALSIANMTNISH